MKGYTVATMQVPEFGQATNNLIPTALRYREKGEVQVDRHVDGNTGHGFCPTLTVTSTRPFA